ncbi:MAG: murein biosynthesis integral membrane protein MurJ [Anaerolineaceae bacterium 4572_78]|nr:MAG: murein biosynthesis integral membrane protein MurJ [Anaerolineaceae bacterium 4572_78]
MTKKANLQTIAKAASLVMIFFIASRVLGLIRDMVIASQFGTSPEMDSYLAAFRLPDLLFNVVAGGALGSAFIPVFTDYLTDDDTIGAWRLASAIINWVLVVTIVLGGLAIVFAPSFINIIAPGFNPEQKILSTKLMQLLMISTIIFGVSGLIMGILHANQHFLSPAIAPVIYNLAIIGGALLLGPIWSVYGLTAGVIVGAVGHLVVQLPALYGHGMRYHFIFMPRNPSVQRVGWLMAPRMFGLAAVHINFLWDAILASTLTSGSYAGLDYGRRVMLLPQGIIAQAVASAAFPTFSALAAQEKWDELQTVFIGTLRSIIYLSVPAAIGLIMLGKPIIILLFQRNAFDEISTQATVWALWFYTLGLVPHAIVEIVTRAFYALKNTKTPVIIGIVSMAINVVLSILLMIGFEKIGLAPHGGIALASSIAVTIEMIWLMVALRKNVKTLSIQPLLTPVQQILLAGGIMAIGLYAIRFIMMGMSILLIALVGVGLGGLIYVVVTLMLGVDEPKIVIEMLKTRIRL